MTEIRWTMQNVARSGGPGGPPKSDFIVSIPRGDSSEDRIPFPLEPVYGPNPPRVEIQPAPIPFPSERVYGPNPPKVDIQPAPTPLPIVLAPEVPWKDGRPVFSEFIAEKISPRLDAKPIVSKYNRGLSFKPETSIYKTSRGLSMMAPGKGKGLDYNYRMSPAIAEYRPMFDDKRRKKGKKSRKPVPTVSKPTNRRVSLYNPPNWKVNNKKEVFSI